MKQMMERGLLFLALLLATSANADPAQNEARARHLFTEVRCVQCQSQDIADSDAKIADDMRRQIRTDIAQGLSDAAIRKQLYDRYGDYVLFRPRWTLNNVILWTLPFLIAVMGAAWLFLRAKNASKSVPSSLSDEEEKKLRDLLSRRD